MFPKDTFRFLCTIQLMTLQGQSMWQGVENNGSVVWGEKEVGHDLGLHFWAIFLPVPCSKYSLLPTVWLWRPNTLLILCGMGLLLRMKGNWTVCRVAHLWFASLYENVVNTFEKKPQSIRMDSRKYQQLEFQIIK